MIGEPAPLIFAFFAGAVLGAVYLAGLWIVVRLLPRTNNAGFWLLSSAALRIGLLVAAFYWVAGGRWEELLVCLMGFTIIRYAATWWAARDGLKRTMTS